jgi:hypothetical protein
MFSLCFCWDDHPPVMRTWPAAPRVGDTVILPEFGDLNVLKVRDVVWEGYDDPSMSVHLYEVGTAREASNGAAEARRGGQY